MKEILKRPTDLTGETVKQLMYSEQIGDRKPTYFLGRLEQARLHATATHQY